MSITIKEEDTVLAVALWSVPEDDCKILATAIKHEDGTSKIYIRYGYGEGDNGFFREKSFHKADVKDGENLSELFESLSSKSGGSKFVFRDVNGDHCKYIETLASMGVKMKLAYQFDLSEPTS